MKNQIKLIKEQITAVEHELEIGQGVLDKIDQEFSQLSFPSERKRMYALIQQYDLWEIVQKTLKDRLGDLQKLLALFPSEPTIILSQNRVRALLKELEYPEIDSRLDSVENCKRVEAWLEKARKELFKKKEPTK